MSFKKIPLLQGNSWTVQREGLWGESRTETQEGKGIKKNKKRIKYKKAIRRGEEDNSTKQRDEIRYCRGKKKKLAMRKIKENVNHNTHHL